MDNPFVLLETSEGDILIELYPEKAPISVANFLQYVDDGYYDGTIFHRVVRKFMIQGGGYTRSYERKTPRESIANEAKNGLSNTKGTVAMARTLEKDSANDQFFINAEDNAGDLDHTGESDEEFGYAVFGEVIEGMDVVKKLNWKVTEKRDGFQNIPKEDLFIKSAYRFE